MLDFAQTKALQKQAREYAEVLFEDYLQPADLRYKLRREYLGENGLALIALKLARHELSQGKRAAGEKLVTEFLKIHPQTIFRNELKNWEEVPVQSASTIILIGAVLPLTGVDAVAGKGLQNGIRFAERNFEWSEAQQALAARKTKFRNRKKNKPRIEFMIRDSESSIVGALRAAQSLLDDPNLVALIGEFEGSASSAIAALAQERRVPILVPVATQNGITSLGEFVFQLNADREHKGRGLAEYAYNYLNCKTFISISPQDDYGQQITDGLSAAVDSLGGQIVAQKWYYEGTEDLGRQFKSIRKAAFQRHMEDTLKVSGVLVDQSNRKSYWKEINRRFLQKDQKRESGFVDELSHPVTNIDAVFLPLYEEDIRFIATQRAYYNIQAIALGGDYWQNLNEEVKKELQKYLDGTIIACDYFVDWESERARNFRNEFRSLIGVTPEKHEVIGYDAATLIFECIKKGAHNPRELRRALAQIDGFVGLKGEVSLNNPSRVNSRVNILKFFEVDLKRIR